MPTDSAMAHDPPEDGISNSSAIAEIALHVRLFGQSLPWHSQKPHPRSKQRGFLWYYDVVVP